MPHTTSPFVQEAVTRFEAIIDNAHKQQLNEIGKVNRGEFFVLKHLYMGDQPITPSMLSSASKTSMARISSLLRVLEKKGYIERRVDEKDRRNVLVTITEEGKAYIDEQLAIIRQNLATIFVSMGEHDTREFLRLIEVFSTASKEFGPP